MSTALAHFDIELNPVEMATNLATRVGHLGQAGPAGLIALSLAQVVERKAPVLYAEFAGTNGVAAAFAVPAQTINHQGGTTA